MEKIDIIIPVYNVRNYLERCIDSVLHQTYQNFNIILIDDGSTDGSELMCDRIEQQSPNVYVIHQKNQGLSVARNTGIEWAMHNTNSEWILFVDSDDWIHPELLEDLLNTALSQETKVVITGCVRTAEKGEFLNITEKNIDIVSFEKYYSQNYKYINIITAWAKLYKKELLDNIRFPKGKLNEDIYTTYKILAKCEKIAIIDAPYYSYFINESSIMNQKWSPKRLDEIYGYEEMIAFMDDNNYKDAKIKLIEIYFWSLDRQIKILNDSEFKQYKQERKLLLKKLKEAIKKYKKIVPVDLEHRHWLLEDLYPIFMKFYWKYKSLGN